MTCPSHIGSNCLSSDLKSSSLIPEPILKSCVSVHEEKKGKEALKVEGAYARAPSAQCYLESSKQLVWLKALLRYGCQRWRTRRQDQKLR